MGHKPRLLTFGLPGIKERIMPGKLSPKEDRSLVPFGKACVRARWIRDRAPW